MKQLHRDDLFGWSVFDEARNLDFHGTFYAKHGGVLIDPVPMSEHDRAHVNALGGASTIVVTNSDHVRAARELAEVFGASLAAPRAERDHPDFAGARFLAEGDEVVPGLRVLELEGSKTPGELALALDDTTLITGDLVRGHVGGRLNLLPAEKLKDPGSARASVARLAALPGVDAVIVGDGWHVFTGGAEALRI
jgi:glyoxylase-like metal-dependent hydrolase (beta-lactamase superfamily II)